MRSLRRRFEESKNTTTITKFNDAILYKNYSKKTIKKNFNELVDKDDYFEEEKRQILQDCYRKTKKERKD